MRWVEGCWWHHFLWARHFQGFYNNHVSDSADIIVTAALLNRDAGIYLAPKKKKRKRWRTLCSPETWTCFSVFFNDFPPDAKLLKLVNILFSFIIADSGLKLQGAAVWKAPRLDVWANAANVSITHFRQHKLIQVWLKEHLAAAFAYISFLWLPVFCFFIYKWSN